MEHKEFGTECEPHEAADTRNCLTKMDQQDFGLVGIGHCLVQQHQQGFEQHQKKAGSSQPCEHASYSHQL